VFGTYRASATKKSLLSATFANPATIRIDNCEFNPADDKKGNLVSGLLVSLEELKKSLLNNFFLEKRVMQSLAFR